MTQCGVAVAQLPIDDYLTTYTNRSTIICVLGQQRRLPNHHMSTGTTTSSSTHRHAVTPLEKQRSQLERLFKDPSKRAFIPPPPEGKKIRPAREMMKNVQGSSAGAGSGEFHVYKASRRREYERIKLMEEESLQVRRPFSRPPHLPNPDD